MMSRIDQASSTSKPSAVAAGTSAVRRLAPFLCFLALLAGVMVPTARGQVIISEFMAANHSTLADEDGDYSDWIELFNTGGTAVDLTGWHLTDDPADLGKWTFPSFNLGANTFALVWASGKNRATPGAPLHTNFKLNSGGGYLALVNASGTVVCAFDPAYPSQYKDVSYGVVQQVTTTLLLASNAPARVLVPANGSLGATWTARTFNDSAWRAGTNGVGYQNSVPGFAVRNFKANVTVGDLTTAENVIASPSLQSAVYTENRNVINYLNTGSGANYGSDNTFPGLTINVDTEDFVLEATGWVTIPVAGNWTFGVNSDDGFGLTVGTFTVSYPGVRGPGDTMQTFNFPAAGEYALRLVYYERGGGSEVEMYAAQGSFTAWNSTNFRLVGDTGNGGLAARSLPQGSVGYRAYINTDVQTSMTNQNATAYLRLPFVVTNTATFHTLTLLMKYDDGFVAYLNGTEVARRNAPAAPAWNSAATASRPNNLAVLNESIDLTPWLGQLVTGTNVLAIQGLNDSAAGDDFLIAAQLAEYRTVNSTNQFFAVATPGTFNNSQPYYFKVEDTKFSPDRGFYDSNILVAITCATTGAVIRCTLDGSAPSLTSGFAYTNAILITNTTTLRAAGFKTGFLPSDPDTQTYIYIRDVLRQTEGTTPGTGWPAAGTGPNNQIIDYGFDMTVVTNPVYSGEISNDLRSIPTFSLVMNVNDLFDSASGIYVNPGQDTITWERPCSLELIYPDGTQGFQVNCGTRIRGGYSRDPSNPKHAFRFFFRTDYGPGQLNYPLCGTTNGAAQSFQKFDLRTFENYSWSFGGDSRFTAMRDVCNRDTQLAMGDAGSHGNYYYLFINGQFWGIYNIDERPEANFGASYFGGTAEQYDTIKTSGDTGYTTYATDGSIDAWFRLWQQATNGFPDLDSYMRVQGNNRDGSRNPAYENLVDVDNLINYMLVHLYGNDLDAPISNFLGNESPNNIFCLRNTNNTAGFRFITHDAEHTYLLENVGIDRFGPFPAGDPFALNADGSYNGFSKSSPGYIWKQLAANAEFRLRVADHVQKYCYNGGVLTTGSALSRFMTRSNEIYSAIVLESARWGNSKRTPSFTRSDWVAAVNAGASYVQQRGALLLSQLQAHGFMPSLSAPRLSLASGSIPAGTSLSVTNPNASGQIYYTLDGSDPRLPGGSISPTALLYLTNLPIITHTYIRTRIKNPATNDWSAVVEANLYVDQDFSKLIVSEIMYNPPGAGATSGDQFEFLELKNMGDRTLDLSGLGFSDGITFNFTNGTLLAAGGHFLLVRSLANFQTRYPGVTPNGVYAGKLDNAGEKLAITNVFGATILSVTYNDAAPWPATPDGFGFSLVAVNQNAPFDLDNPANWRASASPFGSPGVDDPAASIAPLLVNEIRTHETPPATDAVELFNPTAGAVNIGGWFLTDDKNVPMKYRIADGTSIPAGGYIVFDESQFNPTPGASNSFSFSSHGEEVYLFSGDATTNLTGYSHGFNFGGSALDVTFGRYVNSMGEELFPAQVTSTLGTNNAGPRVGPVVINEIMYHPLLGDLEFLELKNITGTNVPLYDPAFPTNTWKINGVGYSFPSGTILGPNGLLLVVGADPTYFRAKYNVPVNVAVLGPFPGALQNSGENLQLQMPGTPDTNGVPWIILDEVRYNDKAPWPVAADGDGPTLQRLIASAYGNDPTNWFTSGMTPGGDNFFNSSPSIALTNPPNGAVFTGPAVLSLQAAASDSDGTVAKVEFFANGLKLGETLSSPFNFSWIAGPGTYTLTARATDNGYATTMSGPVTITVNPPPLGSGTGLRADIYDNMDFTGTTLTRIDPTVNFDWGTGSPDPAIGVDSFSVRWTGMVQPRYTDLYTFTTTSDDGVRLWVNGQLIIDHWVDQSPTDWTGSIQLTAGQLYTIRMDYYENGGGAAAKLSWASPYVPQEIIPQTQLYPFLLPAILVPPASQTVGLGTVATFTVVATNSPTAYQWFFNDSPINGATGPSYTLNNVQFSNAGPYKVTVANLVGSVTSAPAILGVVRLPVITQQPQSQSVDLGGTASFGVLVDGTPPFQYQWRFKGTNLAGATGPTLVLNSVQVTNVGYYNVLVSNAGGSVASANVFLGVNAPCTILEQPQSITLGPVSTNYTTTTTNFSVTAVGMGPLNYQWLFWGTNLPGATNSTLTITNVALSNAGPYAVQVWDSVQTVVSSNALLTLLVRPYILVPIVAQSVVSGGTASFSVWAGPVHPTLPLTYRWLKGGVYVATNDQPTMFFTNVTASTSCQVVVVNSVGTSFKPQVALSVLPDGDGDGMPDAWMTSYFGHTNGLAADKSRPQDDADGDGMTNVQEYQAGTDPTNKLSALKLVFPTTNAVAGGQVTFYFTAISNKTYSVQYQDALPGAGWSNLVNLDSLPTNRVIWVTNVPPPGLRDRFYRAKTPRSL
jgi:hypothetical protein